MTERGAAGAPEVNQFLFDEQQPRAHPLGEEGRDNVPSSAVTEPGASAASQLINPESEAVPEEAAAEVLAAAQSAARGMVMNQTQLSRVMGVTDVTLWEWQKQGLPVLVRGQRGQSNLYDTHAVIVWKVDFEVKKASGPESQKDRLTRLQADKAEMENAVMRGELIPAVEIEPAWAGVVMAVKQALLPLGIRLAPLLESTSGVDAKRELIDEEVRDVLLKLSTYGQSIDLGPDHQGNGVLRAAEEDTAD